jgi:hypothetical protein
VLQPSNLSAEDIIRESLKRFLASLEIFYPDAVQAALEAIGPHHHIEAAGIAFKDEIRLTIARSIGKENQSLWNSDREQRSRIQELEAQIAKQQKGIDMILLEAKEYENNIDKRDLTIRGLENQVYSQNKILALQHERLMGLLGNVDEDETRE